MTGKQYLDELKLRLLRIEVAADGNDQILMTYLNKARRTVQGATLNLFPERYAKIQRNLIANLSDANSSIENSYSNSPINSYRVGLPDDLIEMYEVIIEWEDALSGATYRQQARRLAKQEYWNVQMNAWSVPNPDRPIYTLEQTIQPVKSILLAGLNYFDGSNVVTLWDSAASDVVAELWYTAIVPDLEIYDVTEAEELELSIPPDVDELIIYYAMLYFLQSSQKTYSYQSLQTEIEILHQTIQANYETKKLKGSSLLPSKEPLQGGLYAGHVGKNS